MRMKQNKSLIHSNNNFNLNSSRKDEYINFRTITDFKIEKLILEP